MPKRKIPLVSGYYYHIYNRGIDKSTIYYSHRDYKRFMHTLWYYRYSNLTCSYRRFSSELTIEDRNALTKDLISTNKKMVDVITYCLMPNHYHIIVKQLVDGGVSKYIGNVQNSYARYFNTRRNRDGSVFSSRFKNKLIETDESLKHLIRYVLLNPYSSAYINSKEEIFTYKYSSVVEIVKPQTHSVQLTERNVISELFHSTNSFTQFVFDNADYQRKLEKSKHM